MINKRIVILNHLFPFSLDQGTCRSQKCFSWGQNDSHLHSVDLSLHIFHLFAHIVAFSTQLIEMLNFLRSLAISLIYWLVIDDRHIVERLLNAFELLLLLSLSSLLFITTLNFILKLNSLPIQLSVAKQFILWFSWFLLKIRVVRVNIARWDLRVCSCGSYSICISLRLLISFNSGLFAWLINLRLLGRTLLERRILVWSRAYRRYRSLLLCILSCYYLCLRQKWTLLDLFIARKRYYLWYRTISFDFYWLYHIWRYHTLPLIWYDSVGSGSLRQWMLRILQDTLLCHCLMQLNDGLPGSLSLRSRVNDFLFVC